MFGIDGNTTTGQQQLNLKLSTNIGGPSAIGELNFPVPVVYDNWKDVCERLNSDFTAINRRLHDCLLNSCCRVVMKGQTTCRSGVGEGPSNRMYTCKAEGRVTVYLPLTILEYPCQVFISLIL